MKATLPIVAPANSFWSTPIGILNGQPIYPVGGASPETDADDGDDPESDSGDEEFVSRAEHEALRVRMRAADRRAGKAERELREAQADHDARSATSTTQLAEATTTLAKLEARIRANSVKLAFCHANGYEWHDLTDALDVIGSAPGVEYNPETDEVTGMAEAVADLAKRKPHWVKSGPASEPDAYEVPDEATLMTKYPGIVGRGNLPGEKVKVDPDAERERWEARGRARVPRERVVIEPEKQARLSAKFPGLWKEPHR